MKIPKCGHDYVFLDKIMIPDNGAQYLFYCRKCIDSKVLTYGIAADKKPGK